MGRTVSGILEKRNDLSIVGLDIIPELIEFCNQQIASRFPNTLFHCTSASHPLYKGIESISGFRVEDEEELTKRYEDSFDTAVAFSVFTHLNSEMATRCLEQIRRMIKRTGTLVLTVFLLDAFSRKQVSTGNAYKMASKAAAKKRFYSSDEKHRFTAFDTNEFAEILHAAGFVIDLIGYGHWRGKKPTEIGGTLQDWIVARPISSLPEQFDPMRYLVLNPLLPKDIDPVEHYLRHGYYEYRRY